MQTFEGCPSPFTRLAEGRSDPALFLLQHFSTLRAFGLRLSSFQPAADRREAALTPEQVVPNSPHERRTRPPLAVIPRARLDEAGTGEAEMLTG